MLKEKRNRADDMVLRLESSNAKRDAYIASLTRQLEAKKALSDAKVKRDEKAARRETAAKFQERIARAEEKIKALKGDAITDMVDLAQIDDNLQLIRILKGDDPLTLDAELERLTEWRTQLENADEEFERIATELRDELKGSPILSDSVIDLIDNKTIEVVAANVGVCDFSGSNRDTSSLADMASEKKKAESFSRTTTESSNEEPTAKSVSEPVLEKTTEPAVERTDTVSEEKEVEKADP